MLCIDALYYFFFIYINCVPLFFRMNFYGLKCALLLGVDVLYFVFLRDVLFVHCQNIYDKLILDHIIID